MQSKPAPPKSRLWLWVIVSVVAVLTISGGCVAALGHAYWIAKQEVEVQRAVEKKLQGKWLATHIKHKGKKKRNPIEPQAGFEVDGSDFTFAALDPITLETRPLSITNIKGSKFHMDDGRWQFLKKGKELVLYRPNDRLYYKEAPEEYDRFAAKVKRIKNTPKPTKDNLLSRLKGEWVTVARRPKREDRERLIDWPNYGLEINNWRVVRLNAENGVIEETDRKDVNISSATEFEVGRGNDGFFTLMEDGRLQWHGGSTYYYFKRDEKAYQDLKKRTRENAAALEERKKKRAAEAAAAKREKVAIQIEAVQLWKEYEANEVAADDKYKGKPLLVRGKVQSIDKDFLGNVLVKLRSPNQFMPVSAQIDPTHKSRAAKLKKREKVRLFCTGGTKILAASLKDCLFRPLD